MIPMRGAGRDYQLAKTRDDLTELQADAIRVAVNVARNAGVKTRKALIKRVVSQGFDELTATWAIDQLR